jgi:hypothetical protein
MTKLHPLLEHHLNINRRQFFGRATAGIGTAALSTLLAEEGLATVAGQTPSLQKFSNTQQMTPRAKRVIYLFQSGAPSQMDLFDYKPRLEKLHGSELPGEVRQGQRLTTMTSIQDRFPLTKSPFSFERVGQSGATLSELLPHHKKIADDLCFVRSLHTEAINHDPGITFFQTGSQIPGRPSIGAWLSYGLGSENCDLPAFVVMLSRGSGRPNAQPLFDRLWGAGFLPTSHQGVKLRSTGEPVLFLNNPQGTSRLQRRRLLDDLAKMNQLQLDRVQDPEISTRIAQYEMAYRMQASVPELTDISGEPQHILDMYGPEVTRKGSYAYNCLLARRMAERGVRFVQLFHIGWDQHDFLVKHLTNQCRDTDQASAALVADLKQRGLLEDTLVVWGGEFGRTVYTQGKLDDPASGRDHHPRCFTIWMTGGGVRGGMSYGETDDFCYNIVRDPVHVHDLHATLLHLLGVDHKKQTFRFQGRDFRLTDVHGKVVTGILA